MTQRLDFGRLEKFGFAYPNALCVVDVRERAEPILFANDAFCTLTRYSREQLLGHSCRMLQAPETSAQGRGVLRAAIDARTSTVVDLINARPNGTRYLNRIAVFLVDDTHAVGFQHEVTDLPSARWIEAPLEGARAEKLAALETEVMASLRAILSGEALDYSSLCDQLVALSRRLHQL
ncbi:MAG: PAS domain-containing protein [Nannocystaceae bacterium]|nr:PAS domain-containing protein [bacterium]